ncbi:NUDIX hydrolase [Paramicrobacterium fandaimingii]|uniref:NUDIX hydrolase n=1 Tax=Paramicrobacterium fandaimingii TaxID=2708079 RepID=UPI001F1ACB4A|nr:NUDIX domain-containing protein [Microbacterium fandaimingii]
MSQVRSRGEVLARQLQSWVPLSAEQTYRRQEYLEFLGERGESSLDREGGSDHLTASCFIFTPDFRKLLLCFHKKGQFWVQLGGHIEGADATIAAAAERESREESGLDSIRMLRGAPFDLNRHELASSFGRCRCHWDLGFAAIGAGDPRTSDESEDVAWWAVDELPERVPWDFRVRVANVRAELSR